MTDLRITHKWKSCEEPVAEVGKTTAEVRICIGGRCLTKSRSTFSNGDRDFIHVSLYPLAMWFASSWWRLNHEVLPDSARNAPPHDWRMSHELAAANMGFIWPRIIFSPDDNMIQIWSQASQSGDNEAVRFMNGLDAGQFIPKDQFVKEVSTLVENVITRLDAVGCKDSDLAAIWSLVTEDTNKPEEHRKRRMEAVLGFDPECCPEDLIRKAIELENRMGPDALSELSGAYARNSERMKAIQGLVESEGLEGKPGEALNFDMEKLAREPRNPWEVAVPAAREVRNRLSDKTGPIKDKTLYDILGLPAAKVKDWLASSPDRAMASVAEPKYHGRMKFVQRRRHPLSQRFELARLAGDVVRTASSPRSRWLVSADLSTARQKFQRAFAAEFLCPINSLLDFLGNDFADSALEEASNHFMVSEKAIESILMNNNYLSRSTDNDVMPYSLPG